MITDPQRDEQSTEGRREMVETHSGDGERRNADQAENPQPAGGDNDQRPLQGDPGRPCEPRFDLQERLKELEAAVEAAAAKKIQEVDLDGVE